MRLPAAILGAATLFGAGQTAAQTITQVDDYTLFDQSAVAADLACQQNTARNLGRVAEGFNEMQVPQPQFWDSNITGIRVFTYSNVKLLSDHGDFVADIVCITAPERKAVVEVAMSFDGKGMAGFKSITSKPRSETFRQSTVFQTVTEY